MTGGVGVVSFFVLFLPISAAASFHFHIPLSLLLFGIPASAISSALFPTKIKMRCCLFTLHSLSSSCRALPPTMREVGMMKQQVRKRRKACTCQGTRFHTPYLLIHWISLSIFNQIWWRFVTPRPICWFVDKKEISQILFTCWFIAIFHFKPCPIRLPSSPIPPQLPPSPKGFKYNSEWQFAFSYNAKRKGILIKFRISKCPFAQAIYSGGAKASLYRGHVLFTSRRTCFMRPNHE